ncbi:hypothetical protein E2542_SST05383 [Spatholobus suberectus]|nr:hypothetical protein E2542_SST05383 [Spatholobus suberectus]
MKLSFRNCFLLALIFAILMVTQTVAQQQTCTKLLLYYSEKCDIVTCTNACVDYFVNYTAVGLCFPDGCHCENNCPS